MTGTGPKNTRAAERHPLTLPVATDAGEGLTRDVSTQGVYFTCKGGFQVGARITFSIMLGEEGDGAPLRLRCSGKVVRIDTVGDEVGVGAKISSYTIEP